MKHSLCGIAIIIAALSPYGVVQDTSRVKIAQGEYRVYTDQDLGVGPVDTEVFHFREFWTLWRDSNGTYEVEGERKFESPLGEAHDDNFWAQLGSDLRLTKVKEFTQLAWVPDSGPLTCDLLPTEMKCNSGGKDPLHTREVQLETPLPYGILWPISAFSIGGLAQLAAKNEGQTVAIDLVTLNELSKSVPVFTIRSRGSIRYLGKSKVAFSVSGKSWYPRVFELTSGPTRKLHIWTSPEGLVLAIKRADWPKTTMQLISFQQFAEFPRGDSQ